MVATRSLPNLDVMPEPIRHCLREWFDGPQPWDFPPCFRLLHVWDDRDVWHAIVYCYPNLCFLRLFTTDYRIEISEDLVIRTDDFIDEGEPFIESEETP